MTDALSRCVLARWLMPRGDGDTLFNMGLE